MGRRALIMISTMLIAVSINLGLTTVVGATPKAVIGAMLLPLLAAFVAVLLKWGSDRGLPATRFLIAVGLACGSVYAYTIHDVTATLVSSSFALIYAALFIFKRTEKEKERSYRKAYEKLIRPTGTPAPPLLNEPETREAIVRARVVELESKIEPDQKELARLREEQYQLDQKKGYRGST